MTFTPAKQHLTVRDTTLLISYTGKYQEFSIDELNSLYIGKRKIPYHGLARIILLILLIPLILLCIELESLYWTIGLGLSYALLYVLHDLKTYTLCVQTKTGKRWSLAVKRRDKKRLLAEISDFLDDFYELMKK
ncbi:hypothetical protein ABH942_002059 [Flavobacterium sp. 28YEA47A]|uniref:hypothetical protein n=1 Tax=Flavobacterium sp. 28YEA47A TaxID=3156276 RepID=UPI003519D77C